MDVFGIALAAGGDLLRDAAIDAGYELGLFTALAEPRTLDELASAIDVARGVHRLRALCDLLVALGVLVRQDGDRFTLGVVPARPGVARVGWGLMSDVIRSNKPLDVEGGEIELRYHEHLTRVGAPAARELSELIAELREEPAGDPSASMRIVAAPYTLVDLGAGAGTYTHAFLETHVDGRATVVDYTDVIVLAKRMLAKHGERVKYVAHDIRGAPIAKPHDVVLLANVLHLHPPDTCLRYLQIAAAVTAPGGMVIIKDLRVDDDRRGPYEGLAFALNMAVFTGGGDVYTRLQLRGWLEAAGLVSIEERRLETQPDGIVMIGYKPRGAKRAFEAVTGLNVTDNSDDAMPPSFRTMLAHAVAYSKRSGDGAKLVRHYTGVMPEMRRQQLAPTNELFHTPLDWSRLPRLTTIVQRLNALLAECGVEHVVEQTPTIAALYERSYYGGFMPLLYGYPADLAYFEKRGKELGLDTLGTIDRYFAAPMLHELCHFDRDRDALLPPHLDECIAGWIGVHVWPEMAYPEPGHDDAIYAAPWLSQVGQAVARAFGVRAVVRGQSGAEPWDAALPKRFVDAVTRFGWEDWCTRRTQHFLSDTFDPNPWVALVGAFPPDPELDRRIVRDALRAMCLENTLVDGSFRTRTVVPNVKIRVAQGWMTMDAKSDVDPIPPRYWVPPSVRDRGVRLASLDDIERTVDYLLT